MNLIKGIWTLFLISLILFLWWIGGWLFWAVCITASFMLALFFVIIYLLNENK